MDIDCPYCQFRISLKGVRAGRFTPKCPGCHEAFALSIPDGDGAVPRVKAIAKPAASVTLPPAGQSQPPAETMAPQSAIGVTAPPVPAPVAPHDGGTARFSGHVIRPAEAGRVSADPLPNPPPEDREREPDAAPHPSPAVAHGPSRPALLAGDDIPTSLGGYQIAGKLGQGGMGAVYLARQVSLDRDVALKVLSPQLAEDKSFVARFTREAFAAAQLVHHNVVQVYDIGEDKNRHFYSMEFVQGENLGSLLHKNGKLDPDTAVAYTLQAARGLKFAHDRGLIHRDVKPDNLLLNAEGVVKVADLGLVKKGNLADLPAPGGSKLQQAQSATVTGVHMSMGTPAYMAPEQARDAATVDRRADIYSLGCTLYDLLVGRPPFTGKTAVEVLTKHASEPVTPPDMVSKRVPKEVSALLMKMVAKRPEERYGDMGQVILAMEDFLGTSSTGPFTPKEEHAAAVETAAKEFRAKPLAQAARWSPLGFFSLCALCALCSAVFMSELGDKIVWGGTFVGLGVLTFIAYVVIAGIAKRDETLTRLRPMLFGAKIGDWARTLLVVAVAGLLLYAFGLLGAWMVVALVAAGCAAAFVFGLQLPRDRQRLWNVEGTMELIRSMRLRGLDEDTLRQFICRYSGEHWEEFYEALFGYDAKMDARRRWGLSLRGKARPKFAVWRDAIIGWANARANARKADRERRILQRAEEAKLRAEGYDLLHARKAARREAAAMVRQAETRRIQTERYTEAQARSAATAAPMAAPAIHAPPPQYVQPVIVQQAAASGIERKEIVYDDGSVERDHESSFTRRGGVLALVFGPGVRMIAALLLLAAFVLWFRQNNPEFPKNFGQQMKEIGDDVIAAKREVLADKVRPGDTAQATKTATPAKRPTKDLQLEVLPETVRHRVSGYPVGLAGVLLLLSCFLPNWRAGFFAVAGAALMVAGEAAIPISAGVAASTLATLAGLGLFALGVAFGRVK